MLDGKAIGSQVLEAVRGYVARAVSDLSTRIADIDSRLKAIPAARDGKDGVDGKEGSPGKDGRDGVDGKDGTPGEPGAPGSAGEKGIDGLNGRDGVDGKSITVDEILPTVKQWFDAIPRPLNGKDGADGKDGTDGKSVSIDDLRVMFEAEQAKALLELERRGSDLIQRCIDRIEKPKDGVPGKDGRDAFNLEDVEIQMADDERTLKLAFIRGEERVERSVVLTHPVYRHIYKHGQRYQKGDWVTFGGSVFTAQRDTEAKPETDDSWKLSIKRGRDGKDGVRGEKGERGLNAKDYKEGRSTWGAS